MPVLKDIAFHKLFDNLIEDASKGAAFANTLNVAVKNSIKNITMGKTILFGIISIIAFILFSCGGSKQIQTGENEFNYIKYGRLTDPMENEYLLKELPDDFDQMCKIANLQSVHHTMLSQWKIPRSEWKIARANHDIKDILDTLKVKGDGKLSVNRELKDRIFGACTKESIFSTSMLRAKGIPARIRVGYFTNLYSGEKAVEFWRNVNNYANTVPYDSAQFDEYTLYMKSINKAIEHWVTEYWDKEEHKWRILDIRPEYLQSYGLDVDFHLPDQYFEFGYEAWQRINSPEFINDAYSESDLDGKSHIRYQMLMDFYSLLNHDVPGIFDDNGQDISGNENNNEIRFLRKKYDELSEVEIKELDDLAILLGKKPGVAELIGFYNNSSTLKINSIEKDKYSFIYISNKNAADKNK